MLPSFLLMLTLSQGGVVITKGHAPLARTTFPPYGQFASRSGAGLPVVEDLCSVLDVCIDPVPLRCGF